VAVEKILH